MDTIAKAHSYRTLAAHGTAVGLSEGLMGNSEVGCAKIPPFGKGILTNVNFGLGGRHLNIGAGRVVWQDIVRIDMSIKKRRFHKSPNIVGSMQRAKDGNGRLHLLGLVSSLPILYARVLLRFPQSSVFSLFSSLSISALKFFCSH